VTSEGSGYMVFQNIIVTCKQNCPRCLCFFFAFFRVFCQCVMFLWLSLAVIGKNMLQNGAFVNGLSCLFD
jgi:hypothetical protein